jgi:hypothetical protein
MRPPRRSPRAAERRSFESCPTARLPDDSRTCLPAFIRAKFHVHSSFGSPQVYLAPLHPLLALPGGVPASGRGRRARVSGDPIIPMTDDYGFFGRFIRRLRAVCAAVWRFESPLLCGRLLPFRSRVHRSRTLVGRSGPLPCELRWSLVPLGSCDRRRLPEHAAPGAASAAAVHGPGWDSWPAPPGGTSRSMQHPGQRSGGRGCRLAGEAAARWAGLAVSKAADWAALWGGASILQGKKGPAAAVASTRGDRGRS